MIVLMGSGAETAQRRWTHLVARGEKVGVLKVRLYRPFSVADFVAALPPHGDARSPCSTAPRSRAASASRSTWTSWPRSRRRTPQGLAPSPPAASSSAAATGCRRRSSRRRWSRRSSTSWRSDAPQNHFTVGIVDDVTHTSLPSTSVRHRGGRRRRARVLRPRRRRHGRRQQELDQDHRRGDRPHAQGYFVYDSKKSGA